MMRIIKILLIVVFTAFLVYVSFVKIDNIILKDFDVVNFKKLHEKNGLPVYTMKMTNKNTYFVKDITLMHSNGLTYDALASKDIVPLLKMNANVYVPKSLTALRGTFDPSKENDYYMGKVTAISKEADWQTGLYKIRVLMKAKLPVYPFYTGKVVVAERSGSLSVPITYLENAQGKYFAWVCGKDSKAQRVAIQAGVCDGYNCEIKSGVKQNDLLITSDLKELKQDMLLNNVGVAK